MATNRTSILIELTREEENELERLSRSHAVPHGLVVRAKLIRLLAAGQTVSSVAREVGLERRIVGKWANRFIRKRIRGLEDAPRSGRPARFSPGDRAVPGEASL